MEIVKEGTLSLDDSLEIGAALDEYKHFSETNWRKFEDRGRTIVECRGTWSIDSFKDLSLDVDEFRTETIDQAMIEEAKQRIESIEYVVQFVVTKDEEPCPEILAASHVITAMVSGIGEMATKEKVDSHLETLSRIWKNEPDNEVFWLIYTQAKQATK